MNGLTTTAVVKCGLHLGLSHGRWWKGPRLQTTTPDASGDAITYEHQTVLMLYPM